MKPCAAILTVGDELILGDRADTNGPWLSRTLLEHGIKTSERCSVSDSIPAISKAIIRLAKLNSIVFVTGGLGPTEDDRTTEALADALGEQLVHDDDALASIEKWFEARGVVRPPQNDIQAMRPISSDWIENKAGTAPGLLATIGNCTVVCLPGPPSELQPMLGTILPDVIAPIDCTGPVCTTEVRAWGMPESVAGEKIAAFMQQQEPRVSILMGKEGIVARVTSADASLVKGTVSRIQELWSPWAFGTNEATLASSIGELLVGGSVSTAESCTAGLLCDAFANTPGASKWFVGGWVTYANEMKMSQLGVAGALIDSAGAVSAEVARAMSEGAVACSGSLAAVSTTGIAGPTGGTTRKPLGTVFIGCTVHGDTTVREFRFTGTRNEVRQRATFSALQMLRFRVLDLDVPTMCWQHGEVFT
tara:strand:+ start:4283 stop:5542 length:1260 start_codon:yes stop_codon:yes gene_type:complete